VPPTAISTKQSPPIPVMAGSTTPSTAAAAIAASIAVPPASSIWIAVRVARGWAVAAAASPATTTERPAA
jgi:hypothetical protein